MEIILHGWITSEIVKLHLVQIGRIDGPTEYLSQILAAIRLFIIREICKETTEERETMHRIVIGQ